MSINLIEETIWPDILKLQSEAYYLVEPESFEVMKDKWLCSPESCFVYKNGQQLLGYLLAHSWHSKQPPKLYQPLPKEVNGSILFLHDLAVSKLAKGKGVASKMFSQLLNVAISSGYQQIRLVSVQDSKAFWMKLGFVPAKGNIFASYGVDAVLMQRVLKE